MVSGGSEYRKKPVGVQASWLTVFAAANKCYKRSTMSTSADREKMLAEMTRAEKADLLRWIVRDLGDDFPGIESKPDVMGGVPCITRTRIPVWVLEQARRLGTSEADLLRDYPTLTVQDLANAWNFVRSHRAEIDAQIEANEKDDD
jgi:uncharacterized protein (DUF433 family)